MISWTRLHLDTWPVSPTFVSVFSVTTAHNTIDPCHSAACFHQLAETMTFIIVMILAHNIIIVTMNDIFIIITYPPSCDCDVSMSVSPGVLTVLSLWSPLAHWPTHHSLLCWPAWSTSQHTDHLRQEICGELWENCVGQQTFNRVVIINSPIYWIFYCWG